MTTTLAPASHVTSSARHGAVALVAAVALAALAALVMPRPPSLSDRERGDAALADQVRDLAGDAPVQALAVARGTGGHVTASAAIGDADARRARVRAMTASTPQEIGSVAKSMTGLLFADAVARGEVDPDTTLGQVYPDAGLDERAAAITLQQLATHRSGLPSLAGRRLARALVANLTHGNPYAGQSPQDLLADASTPLARDPGDYRYSNLGFSLLGQALATRAGTSYPALLDERVLRPLGMHDTVAAPVAPPAGAAHESAANGAASAPWISTGGAPAGTGIWSTADDLGRLMAAVAAGTAVGLAATTPTAGTAGTDQEALRTGWGWFTLHRDSRRILLNNGATGGGASSVALDLDTRSWVAVTAPSSASTQTVALRLLGVRTSQPVAEPASGLTLAATVVLLLLPALPLLQTAWAGRARGRAAGRARPSRMTDRAGLLAEPVAAVGMLLLARSIGAWQVVPAWTWPVAVAAAALATLVRLRRWRLAAWPGALRWLTVLLSTVVWVVIIVAVLARA